MPRVVRMSLVTIMVLASGGVFGQDYPNRPIRIIATSLGSAGDSVSRLIAQGLTGTLGQQVVVDNRPGVLGGELLSKAPPDGHTLHVTGNGLWVTPLMQKVPYDMKDFSPIMTVTSAPKVIVVNPSVPAKSIRELIALAKARPGELNYGSSRSGGSGHLAAELFKSMAGVNITRIPYKGSAFARVDLLAGRVQVMLDDGSTMMPHIKSGKLIALGVTSAEPSAMFPGVPAVAATVPGYESVTIIGMFAPAKTPAAIIKRLNQEVVRVLNSEDAKGKVFDSGAEIVGSSPEQLAAAVQYDTVRLGKVIKDLNIRGE